MTGEMTHESPTGGAFSPESDAAAPMPPAPCNSHNPDMWFSAERGEILTAIALCRTCPQLSPCLKGALSRKESAGVWGGSYLVEGKIAALPGSRPDYPGLRRIRWRHGSGSRTPALHSDE